MSAFASMRDKASATPLSTLHMCCRSVVNWEINKSLDDDTVGGMAVWFVVRDHMKDSTSQEVSEMLDGQVNG